MQDLKHFTTDETVIGQRLDQWLTDQFKPEFSRSRLQALIKEGNLTIDNVVIREPKTKLRAAQKVTLTLPPPVAAWPIAENIALDILYEDEDLIVINKPAGLVVHPGNGNWDGTLVNALIYHCGDSLSGIGGVKRPGIVHRLDKNTSGVMVAAKNDFIHSHLSAQFADHGRTGVLERNYIGILWGLPSRSNGTVETSLGRARNDRTRQAVVNPEVHGARHAVTHFKVLEAFGAKNDATATASLVQCRLETGRTHQIRVHMAHIGHPLVGDMDYGSAFKTKVNKLETQLAEIVKKFQRQALHAQSLTFEHPRNGEILTFRSPPPQDFQELISAFQRLPSNTRILRQVNYI